MLAEIGAVSLFAAFVSAIASLMLAIAGARSGKANMLTAARNTMLLTFPLILFAALLLIYAQINGHYEITYVNNVSKDTQPFALKITALWGGQAGSLVLWSFLLSAFTCTALVINWKQENHLMPWVIVVAGGTLAFFLLLNNFYENPFQRTWMSENVNSDAIEEAIFQPKGMVLAYPYQSSEGAFYF